MRNFGRALRNSLRYPYTIAGAVVCSLVVAMLWGANIAALGPVAEVLLNPDGGRTLHQWAQEKIDETQEELRQLQQRALVVEQQRELGDAGLKQQRAIVHGQRQVAQGRLNFYRRLQPAIARVFPDDAFGTMVVLMALLGVATLVKCAFLIVGNLLVDRVAQCARRDLQNSFYKHALSLDLSAFRENDANDWMARFTSDITLVSQGVQMVYGRLIREPLKMIACAVGAMVICWRLFLFSMVVVPLAALLIGQLTRALRRAGRRSLDEISGLYSMLGETLGAFQIVKAFTMENAEARRFARISQALYRKCMRFSLYNALLRPTGEIMGLAVVSCAMLAGAYLALNEETHLFGFLKMSERPISLPMLLVFYGMLAGMSDPGRKISSVIGPLQNAAAAADRVHELMDRKPTMRCAGPALTAPKHREDLVFRNVHFGYRPNQSVLSGVHLRVPFGETIALVGPNGCGKTTLASLVPRFYDPDQGAVLLDGVDLRSMNLRSLRKQIGLVTQDPVLFNDTVANNIRYGLPEASDEQVQQAAEMARAHGFVANELPQGYQTMVGPRGDRLSGGQRQRIALARALLRDPAIMILDEATSQVDLESEQLIQNTLAQLAGSRTIIMITHRLSVLYLADRIIVMSDGMIEDQGTHHALIQRCPLYQRLYQADFRQSA